MHLLRFFEMHDTARNNTHSDFPLQKNARISYVKLPIAGVEPADPYGHNVPAERRMLDRDAEHAGSETIPPGKSPGPEKLCGKKMLPPKGGWPVITTVRMESQTDEVVVAHDEQAALTSGGTHHGIGVRKAQIVLADEDGMIPARPTEQVTELPLLVVGQVDFLIRIAVLDDVGFGGGNGAFHVFILLLNVLFLRAEPVRDRMMGGIC
jgi:hypothetical protein